MNPTLGLYRPGDSVLHRLPAGVKLVALALLGMASILLQRSWVACLVVLGVVAATYLLCRFDVRTMWQQVRPLAYILVITAAFQWWASDWRLALSVTANLVLLVLAAALVTLTTRSTEMVDVVVRATGWLRRFGVDPERVALLLNLGIRCVPLVAGIANQVKEAQVARSGTFSLQAFTVPFVVRCLREADQMGDALAARGVDD